mgnify:CR=1 FL=1
MKIKSILNKLNYSITEKKIKNEVFHQIYSDVITKLKETAAPNTEEKIELFLNNDFKTKSINTQTIKISKSFSKQSKHINSVYKNKIIGPIELKLYKNENFLAKNVSKKIKKTESIWFIRIKNFSIEMPEENYSLWQYNFENKKSILKTEILISLYLIPLSQFFTYSVGKLEN